jgi:vesicle-fusing ATPase
MKTSKALDEDVDLKQLAAITDNFTGAELVGLVRNAASFGLKQYFDDSKTKAASRDVKVNREHFLRSLEETKPSFGKMFQNQDKLTRRIIHFNREVFELEETVVRYITRVINSKSIHTFSILLDGPVRSGLSSLAWHFAMQSGISFVRSVSSADFVGLSEKEATLHISQVFENAYRCSSAIIILDCIEQILNLQPGFPRFNRVIASTLLALLKTPLLRDNGHIIVLGTTNTLRSLEEIGIIDSFNVVKQVPLLQDGDSIRKGESFCFYLFALAHRVGMISVLEAKSIKIEEKEAEQISSAVGPLGIKSFLTAIELSQDDSRVLSSAALLQTIHDLQKTKRSK